MKKSLSGTVKPARRPYRAALSLLPLLFALGACVTPPPAPPAKTAEPIPPRQVIVVPPKEEILPAEQEALRTMVALQDRLDRVVSPLLVNNPELCRGRGNARNLLGFTAKNKYSFPPEYADAAQKMFGLGERLQVMSVLAGSGAAKAGLRRGDILIAVEDMQVPQGSTAERRAVSILMPLVNRRISIKLTVLREGTAVTLDVPLTMACAFRVELGNTDNVNAYADGHRILVTRGMMNFTQTDSELAFVLAKEMAHNSLLHPNRLRINSTVGGIIDNLLNVHPDMNMMTGTAGIKTYTQDMDAAADTLSLYMIARAGYDIDDAPLFWQKLASQYPPSTLTGYTAIHPSTAYRVSAMEKTLREIKSKKAAQKPLLP